MKGRKVRVKMEREMKNREESDKQKSAMVYVRVFFYKAKWGKVPERDQK